MWCVYGMYLAVCVWYVSFVWLGIVFGGWVSWCCGFGVCLEYASC